MDNGKRKQETSNRVTQWQHCRCSEITRESIHMGAVSFENHGSRPLVTLTVSNPRGRYIGKRSSCTASGKARETSEHSDDVFDIRMVALFIFCRTCNKVARIGIVDMCRLCGQAVVIRS